MERLLSSQERSWHRQGQLVEQVKRVGKPIAVATTWLLLLLPPPPYSTRRGLSLLCVELQTSQLCRSGRAATALR
ncbi:hypothetical protein NDU88_004803 [Pleurodeles waltl]|uniref:Uncharacterized protein n=1 Tax=Pleurodeles waltl TaxID=8319 RepID=A0AAV7SJV3_PLEWA|nr:hypothetical protein NDU88_004803 [Pleurodeles waltl]